MLARRHGEVLGLALSYLVDGTAVEAYPVFAKMVTAEPLLPVEPDNTPVPRSPCRVTHENQLSVA